MDPPAFVTREAWRCPDFNTPFPPPTGIPAPRLAPAVDGRSGPCPGAFLAHPAPPRFCCANLGRIPLCPRRGRSVSEGRERSAARRTARRSRNWRRWRRRRGRWETDGRPPGTRRARSPWCDGNDIEALGALLGQAAVGPTRSLHHRCRRHQPVQPERTVASLGAAGAAEIRFRWKRQSRVDAWKDIDHRTLEERERTGRHHRVRDRQRKVIRPRRIRAGDRAPVCLE
ncbi:hypothetical protein ACPA9J_29935 [Pseudomonas aeruginosa]